MYYKTYKGAEMKKIAGILLLAFSTQVFADQCAYITKEQAKRALRIAVEAEKVELFCEPCGETVPTLVPVVSSIGIRDVNYKGFWELQVNGKGVDLAYTFVDGLNLSKLAKCGSSKVSFSIKEY
jgi:hypothetical protein